MAPWRVPTYYSVPRPHICAHHLYIIIIPSNVNNVYLPIYYIRWAACVATVVAGWLNCVRIKYRLAGHESVPSGEKKLQFSNFCVSVARRRRRRRGRTSGPWRIGLMTGKPTRHARQTRFSLFLDQRKWPANRRTSSGNNSGPSGLTNSSPAGSKVLGDHSKILAPET